MVRKYTLGALGAIVGIGAYRKLDSAYSRLLPLVVAALVALNAIKWLMFGKLGDNEVRGLRHNIGYTLWEFWLAWFVFHSQGAAGGSLAALLKFGSLFACVLLVKCFHYLASERVTCVVDSYMGGPLWLSMMKANDAAIGRFAVGLLLIIGVDCMLISRFFIEVGRRKIDENILVGIFGFEILHLAPLIALTLLNFALGCFCRRRGLPPNVRTAVIAEFAANLIKFVLMGIFATIFLYLYTFPLHILPLSYLLLRVLVDRSRVLVNYYKRQFVLRRLDLCDSNGTTCTICFDDDTGDWRQLGCGHQFHFQCLEHWVDILKACPVCRERI